MRRTGPHDPITSRENSIVKRLRSLSDPRQRRKERAFLIEGNKMVEEALRNNAPVVQIAAAPSLTQRHGRSILRLAESRSLDIVWITEKLLDSVSESKTPQPVMALVSIPEHAEEALLAHPSGLVVVCHELQDPGNLGTIIRTAEAVGAAGVAVTPHTVDPYGSKAVRASMGSILRVPLVRIASARDFLDRMKQKRFQTVALVLGGARAHVELDLTGPTVVVLGQESAGLGQDVLAGIDHQVRIPMADTIDSLNVATSAAVFLYEAMRQRTA